MIEGLMLEMIRFLESDAAAVVILAVAVAVLWYALERRITNHVKSLTIRLNHCEERHGKCERQHQELAAAIMGMLSNNRESAMRNVEHALRERENDDEDDEDDR